MALLSRLTVRMEAQTGAFITDMERAARRSKRTGTSIKNGLTAGVALAGAAFVAASKKAAEFEEAMAEVSTLVDTATTDMDELSQSVLNASTTFGGDAKTNAKALYDIISAGAEAGAESTRLLNAANMLAVGGVTDVATAADGLTTVMNAYGFEVNEASRVTDIMFSTMKAGKTTIGELATNYGQVVTLAATAGISFEELSAAAASLTKVGLGTSESMTAIRSILIAVNKQSGESVAKATELGIAFDTNAIKSMGFARWLGHVAEKSKMSDKDLSKLFGRVEGLTGVLALGANEGKEFNEVLDGIREGSGSTLEAYEKMSKTAAHQFKLFKARVSELAIIFGTKFLPAINDALWALTDLFRLMGEESDKEKMARVWKESSIAIEDYQATVKTLEREQVQSERRRLMAIIATSEGLIRQLEEEASRWDRQGSAGDEARASLEQMTQAQILLNEQLKAANAALVALPPEIEEVGDAADGIVTPVTDVSDGLEAVVTNVERLGGVSISRDLQDWFAGFVREIDPAIARSQDFALAQGNINALIAADPENRAMYLKFLEDYKKKLEGAAEKGKKLSDDTPGHVAVMEEAWKRLDTAFKSMWDDFFENGKLSLDGIKDLFKSVMAELAHQAITKPIMMRLGAQMGIGGSAAGTGLLGLGGGFGGLLGSLGIGAMLGAGGSSQEQWGSTIGGGLGYLTAGMTAPFVSSLLTSFATSGFGTAIASTLGSSVLTGALNFVAPLVGPLVGALLGKFIGKALARDPEVTFQGSNFAPIEEQSLFGGFDVRARGGTGPQEDPESFAGQAIQAIRDFDDALGQFMTEGQIEKIVQAMAGWRVNLKNSAVKIENILDSRFAVVLSTFNQHARDFVNGFEGLEAQTQALAEWVTAFNTMSAALATYVSSTIPDFQAVRQIAGSSKDVLRTLGQDLRDAMTAFDGTPETMNAITQAIANRYDAEMAYIRSIDDMIRGLSQSIASQKAQVRSLLEPDLDGDKGVEELLGRARSLVNGLRSAESPEEIARIVQQVQALVSQAQSMAGSLVESLPGRYPMRQMTQEDFVAIAVRLLSDLESTATSRALTLREEARIEADALRAETAAFAEAQQISLDEIVAASQDTVGAINDQTIIIDEGNASIREELVVIKESLQLLANEARGKSDRDVIREELVPVS